MHWTALRAHWLAAAPPADLRPEADAFTLLVDRFVAAIEARIGQWTTILHGFQLALVGLAITSAVVMFYTGYLFVLNPVARLRRDWRRCRPAISPPRVEVDTRDEFGELAAGFNDMAQTLQSLYGGLEDKVREKTLRLELKRQRLADLYEVSAFVAEAPTLEALAQGFARHVRRIAEADAAAVRWCDDTHQRYLMLAHDRLPQELALAGLPGNRRLRAVPPPRGRACSPSWRTPTRAWATAGPASPAWCRCRCACTSAGGGEPVLPAAHGAGRGGPRTAGRPRQPPRERDGEPARERDGTRGGGGAGTQLHRPRTARLHRAVARLHEDPGAAAAPGRAAGTRPPCGAPWRNSTRACAKATPTCASC